MSLGLGRFLWGFRALRLFLEFFGFLSIMSAKLEFFTEGKDIILEFLSVLLGFWFGLDFWVSLRLMMILNFWLRFWECLVLFLLPFILIFRGLECALFSFLLLKEVLNLYLFLLILTPLDLNIAKGSSSKKDFDFSFLFP